MRQTKMRFLVKSYYSATARKAFTLIELLVVIAIIGVLATILIVFYDNAQANGRDTRRIADLSTIADAGMLLYAEEKTFLIIGTGLSGSGEGHFNHLDPANNYPKTINKGFIEKGYLPGVVIDPTGGTSGLSRPSNHYMYYAETSANSTKLSVYCRLEKGTQAQLDVANQGADHTTAVGGDVNEYNMNFAVTVIP